MSISTFTKASIASSIILLLSGQASAAGYKFTDLNGTLLYSTAKGINLSGQVVGTMGGTSGKSAVRWDKGVATELRYAGEDSYGAGINDAGQVAAFSGSNWENGKALVWKGNRATVVASGLGFYRSIGSVSGINNHGAVLGTRNIQEKYGSYRQSAIWNGANTTYIGPEENPWAPIGNSINDAGQVVGYIDESYHAFSWKDGVLTTLPDGSGAYYGEVRAVNNAGLVVGSTYGDDGNHAVLWNDGKAIGLPTLHGDNSGFTTAEALNNVGQIVGQQSGRALLWEDGNVIDLNTFLSADLLNDGWRLTEATGVNDHGWIVGNMVKGTGSAAQIHAFMLMPVPEPETYAMLLAGLGLMGFQARRRRA
ncbi:PEP-CTERM sorting domain-containing protein [Janthinobacterium sp.]|uniref:PEP-CTERM sorting domain-containing protein n=1 Tax=Janthinobacterium sp. TaxID=1871054 RepID=UPI00293D6E8A|nr:PEP-CTERM sorting domain-containing protein [Janthinobacterium sp.]